MGYSLPNYIKGEQELSVYEQFLKKTKLSPKSEANTLAPCTQNVTLKEFLCLNIGKKVRVAILVGSNLTIKIGTLLNVGTDFLTIKQPQGITVINGKDINHITLLN